MGGHPAWDLNPADLAVVSGECSLFLPPPYRQPLLDIHTHPWPGGVSFLRKNPPPSVGFEPTSAGTATSEHCLRQPCGHRATYHLLKFMITIPKKVSYEFDYNHNLNNNFNTMQNLIKPAELIHFVNKASKYFVIK
jgi:hypothetical protein